MVVVASDAWVAMAAGADGSDDEPAVLAWVGSDGVAATAGSESWSHNEMGLILAVAGGEVAEPFGVVLVAGSPVDGLLGDDSEVALLELLDAVGESVGAGW